MPEIKSRLFIIDAMPIPSRDGKGALPLKPGSRIRSRFLAIPALLVSRHLELLESYPAHFFTVPSLLHVDKPCVRLYTNTIRYRMSKTKADYDFAADRGLYSGLIRLHVLHHAVEEPIFGLGMIEELSRHGYRISPGSLYPLLHGLEKKGYLRAREQRNGRSWRKVYRATPLGRKALAAAKSKVRELFRELIEGK